MLKKKGAEILIQTLIEEGVDTMFGYPGGQVIPIFDAIFHNTDKINFYLVRHEQAAAHMADGYARSTGKVGVCLATSGPGATNLVTGIATAYMDSVPMVAITGQVTTNMIGNDAFQEANITGITYSITKHNYLVKDVKDLHRIVKEAFYIARTGRPGPVLIDIPGDVSKAEAEFEKIEKVELRSYKPVYEGNPKQIQKAAEVIMKSRKPVIISGGGVIISGADKELRELAHKTGIPVTMTLLGMGSFPSDDELSLGMPGMHGTVYANHSLQDSDLIISVGARFDDRITGKLDAFAPHAKIIHIDIDPSSIGKSVLVDIPIVGDARMILRELNKLVSKCDIGEWMQHVKELKQKNPLAYKKSEDVIKPQFIMEALSEITGGDAIYVTEVGQHQMWAAQYINYKTARSFLSSGGLGTMGYGFPAAIGAQLGNPDKTVIDISGDGSFQMNIQELATVAMNRIPVKIIILNNMYLGMVRQWQDLFWGKRYSFTCLARQARCPESSKCPGPGDQCPEMIPDFRKVAEAYGIKAYDVSKPADVKPLLKDILKMKEPVLVNFHVAMEENVMPMVPAGSALNQILDHALA
ncbi:MAG: biosynthetic-type acetolactate synthase large subunit [bacterium]|nr:biosynthetic-type acetolactate synthase large subunit [bacterium]